MLLPFPACREDFIGHSIRLHPKATHLHVAWDENTFFVMRFPIIDDGCGPR